MQPGSKIGLSYKEKFATLEYFEGRAFIVKLISDLGFKKYTSYKTAGKARQGFYRMVDKSLHKSRMALAATA